MKFCQPYASQSKTTETRPSSLGSRKTCEPLDPCCLRFSRLVVEKTLHQRSKSSTFDVAIAYRACFPLRESESRGAGYRKMGGRACGLSSSPPGSSVERGDPKVSARASRHADVSSCSDAAILRHGNHRKSGSFTASTAALARTDGRVTIDYESRHSRHSSARAAPRCGPGGSFSDVLASNPRVTAVDDGRQPPLPHPLDVMSSLPESPPARY